MQQQWHRDDDYFLQNDVPLLAPNGALLIAKCVIDIMDLHK